MSLNQVLHKIMMLHKREEQNPGEERKNSTYSKSIKAANGLLAI